MRRLRKHKNELHRSSLSHHHTYGGAQQLQDAQNLYVDTLQQVHIGPISYEPLPDPLGIAERGKVGAPPTSSECSSNSSVDAVSVESNVGLVNGSRKGKSSIPTKSGIEPKTPVPYTQCATLLTYLYIYIIIKRFASKYISRSPIDCSGPGQLVRRSIDVLIVARNPDRQPGSPGASQQLEFGKFPSTRSPAKAQQRRSHSRGQAER